MSQANPLSKPAETQVVKQVVHDESQFSNLLDTGKFEHLWRVATLFAKSGLVPAHFQGQVENCFITCQMAVRLGVDPFMLMQKTYVVHGKPGMEATIAIALMNSSGLFENSIDYEVDDPAGKGPKDPGYRVRAWAVRKDTGKRVDGPWVDWATVKAEGWDKKSGTKWLTMPGLMFAYRAASWFGRLHCPERLMGMQTVDELEDTEVRRFVASEPVQAIQYLQTEEGMVPTPAEGDRPVGGIGDAGSARKAKKVAKPASDNLKGKVSDDVATALATLGATTRQEALAIVERTSWPELFTALINMGCLPAQVEQAFDKIDKSWVTKMPPREAVDEEPPAESEEPAASDQPAAAADLVKVKRTIDARLFQAGHRGEIKDELRYAIIGSILSIDPAEVKATLKSASVSTCEAITATVGGMSYEELLTFTKD